MLPVSFASSSSAHQPLAHSGLVALDGTTHLKREAGNTQLPSRIVVAPWGSHETEKGRIVINERTVTELPRNQQLANFDRVALDFNHNTVPGSESYKGEPAPVAAFAVPRVFAGEGIVFESVMWTAAGREHVSGGHYIDLSPTLQLNAAGEAVFIHSAALCRQGAIPNLSLFSALSPTLDGAAEKGRFRDLLLLILGLSPSASDEEIRSAAKSLGEESMPKWMSKTDVVREKVVTALSARGALDDSNNLRLLQAAFPDAQEVLEEVTWRQLGLTRAQVEMAHPVASGTPEEEIWSRLGLRAEQVATHGG